MARGTSSGRVTKRTATTASTSSRMSARQRSKLATGSSSIAGSSTVDDVLQNMVEEATYGLGNTTGLSQGMDDVQIGKGKVSQVDTCPVTDKDEKPFPLMLLPAEIRNEIYRACLTRPFNVVLSKRGVVVVPLAAEEQEEDHGPAPAAEEKASIWSVDGVAYEPEVAEVDDDDDDDDDDGSPLLPVQPQLTPEQMQSLMASPHTISQIPDHATQNMPYATSSAVTGTGIPSNTPHSTGMSARSIWANRTRRPVRLAGSRAPRQPSSSAPGASNSGTSSSGRLSRYTADSSSSRRTKRAAKSVDVPCKPLPQDFDPLIINILRTSKTVYGEARSILYSENMFTLDLDTASATLACLHQRSRRQIKHVEVEIPCYNEILERFQEMVRLSLRYCWGLKTLVIHMPFVLPGADGSGTMGNTTVYANGFDILRWLPRQSEVVLRGNVAAEIEAVVSRNANLAKTLDEVRMVAYQMTGKGMVRLPKEKVAPVGSDA